MTATSHALAYLARGWTVVPVPPRKKAPGIDGWEALRLTAADVHTHFGPTDNVGVILGDPSGGLVDVDIDCADGLALAGQVLPATITFGRAGKPRSHWLYRHALPGRTRQFRDPVTREMLVEYRANGGQTVFPGSVHESGEAIAWDTEGDPAPAPVNLVDLVGQLAVAILRSRYGDDAPPEVDAKIRQWSGLPPVQRPRTTSARPPDVIERARRYLARIPGAVSGAGGHDQTWRAALAMVKGFGLDEGDALRLLLDDFNPRCDPPWSEREIEHKVRDADRSSIQSGYLVERHSEPPSAPHHQGSPPDHGHGHKVEAIRRRVVANPDDAGADDVLELAANLSPAELFQAELIVKRCGVSIVQWRSAVKAKRSEIKERERAARATTTAGGDLDFTVDRLVRIGSEPPSYLLTIEGVQMRMTADMLLSQQSFKRLFVEHVNRVPRMPNGKAKRPWDDYVNEWLARAETLDLPPESSESFFMKEQIADQIDTMPICERLVEISSCKAIITRDQRRAFKAGPLLGALKNTGHRLSIHELCTHLRQLGCIYKVVRDPIEGKKTSRVWIAPETWPIAPKDEDAEDVGREPGGDDE